ncbi:hypothetical protein EPUL_003834, partial [Erysiphe pulchra]
MLINLQIILISFLRSLKNEDLNLADSIGTCKPINGTDLVYCPEMEEDIIICQKIYGKTILLSIGGAAYNESGFSTEESASDAADKVWANFGPITDNTTAIRPFGKAVVDGFDFDFESKNPNLLPFGTRLRLLIDMYMKSNDKKLLLTAAPQCPFPDIFFGPLLDGSIYYDAIWVQFYNNYCGTDSFLPGNATQTNYNFNTWNKWAIDAYPGHDVQVFMGIPGGKNASTTGYISGELLTSVIQYSRNFSNFGGVMIWEMTIISENKGFLSTVSAAMDRGPPSLLKPETPPITLPTQNFHQYPSPLQSIGESN